MDVLLGVAQRVIGSFHRLGWAANVGVCQRVKYLIPW